MRHRLPPRTKIFVMRPKVTTFKPPQYAIAVPVNKGPGLALPIPIPIIIPTETTTPATTTEETTLPMTTMAPNDLVQLSMFNMWLCSCHVNKCVQFGFEHSESWDSILTKCIMGIATLSLSINMKNCKLASCNRLRWWEIENSPVILTPSRHAAPSAGENCNDGPTINDVHLRGEAKAIRIMEIVGSIRRQRRGGLKICKILHTSFMDGSW